MPFQRDRGETPAAGPTRALRNLRLLLRSYGGAPEGTFGKQNTLSQNEEGEVSGFDGVG